jgi:hypothetical protein
VPLPSSAGLLFQSFDAPFDLPAGAQSFVRREHVSSNGDRAMVTGPTAATP